MKILTVCEGGTVRSVGLARYLKKVCDPGHDALAASWRRNTRDTMIMLCEWAELIIIVEPQDRVQLPVRYRADGAAADKVKVCDVGRDRYLNPFHRDLQQLCAAFVKKEGL